eukprot:10281029-Prorocentrum_lima.AAC.1
MTSSLVGSEMCIRDRLKERMAGEEQRRALMWWRIQNGQQVLVVGLIPVSYTHLTLPTICSV